MNECARVRRGARETMRDMVGYSGNETAVREGMMTGRAGGQILLVDDELNALKVLSAILRE